MKTRIRPQVEAVESRLLLTAGALDILFGSNGMATATAGSITDTGAGVAVQSDLKVVAVGTAQNQVPFHGKTFVPNDAFSVTRFTSSGALDPSFGSGGTTQTYFVDSSGNPISYQQAEAVAIQTDGKIVVAGMIGGTLGAGFAIARYNSDGSLDTTFGGMIVHGKKVDQARVITNFFPAGQFNYTAAKSVLIQPDGEIVAGGYATNSSSQHFFAVARYNADGTLDTTFGSGGEAVSTGTTGMIAVAPVAMAIDVGGRIFLEGSSSSSGQAVACFTHSGTLDPSFAGGQVTVLAPGFDTSYGAGVAVQSTGKIIISGNSGGATADPNNENPLTMARLNTNGTLDTSFGSSGFYVGSGISYGQALVVQPDDKLIAVGQTPQPPGPPITTYNVVTRVTADGQTDSAFGTSGLTQTSLNTTTGISSDPIGVALAGDGKIVGVGTYHGATRGYLAAVRFLGDTSTPASPSGASTVPGAAPGGSSGSIIDTAFLASPSVPWSPDPDARLAPLVFDRWNLLEGFPIGRRRRN
jgi:uncharacterized delta-60 repeat protein